MTNILDNITEYKREFVADRKKLVSENTLLERATKDTRGFKNAIREKISARQTALIAELKKASPSKGLIRVDFNPVEIAKAYKAGGATCLSILTDEKYFQGKDEYIWQAKSVVDLPVLRKDFMLDTYQVVESRAIGADCILLIMAMLDDKLAADLASAAKEFNMDVLVEVHDLPELERALRLDCELIGINNRNLKTMEIDLQTSVELTKHIPDGRLVICESGVESHADIITMQNAEIYGFLVGTSLMKEADIKTATQKLLYA